MVELSLHWTQKDGLPLKPIVYTSLTISAVPTLSGLMESVALNSPFGLAIILFLFTLDLKTRDSNKFRLCLINLCGAWDSL